MDNLGKRLNRHLQREIEGIRGELGKLQDDGTLLVPVAGAANEVYVRLDGDAARTVTAINQQVNPRARLPVRLRRNSSGRYEVIGLDTIPANSFLGENAPSANVPIVEGAAVNALWESHQLKPGKIRAQSESGLGVFMEELAYGDTLLGNVSMNLTTVVGTIGASSKAWVVITVDPETNTLTATKGDDVGIPIPLTREDANAVTVTAGLIKLWAFILRNGDTDLPKQPRTPDTVYFADLRPWLTLPALGGGDLTAIHVDTAGEIDGLAAKSTPVSDDVMVIEDSEDVFNKKKVALGDLSGFSSPQYPQSAYFWHIASIITVGNAIFDNTTIIVAGHPFAVVNYQNTPANGDSFEQPFLLVAGTYTLTVLGITGPNRGKVDWYIDGVVNISGQDWYTASDVVDTKKTGSITVVGDGQHTIKGVVNGHNGSSSDYFLPLTSFWINP